MEPRKIKLKKLTKYVEVEKNSGEDIKKTKEVHVKTKPVKENKTRERRSNTRCKYENKGGVKRSPAVPASIQGEQTPNWNLLREKLLQTRKVKVPPPPKPRKKRF